MDATFQIDFGSGLGVVEPPQNKDAMVIDVIFTRDKARATIASINFIWLDDTARRINAYVEQGKKGGKGIAFGLPMRVTICNGLQFNLFLNLSHSSARFACDQVTCPTMELGGTDWFERETAAKSFWFLTTIGQLGQSDYKKTPYAISTIPNYTQVVSLAFQELVLAWKLRDIILSFTEKEIEVSADVVESAVPIVGTPHIVVTTAHVINIVLRIADIVITLVAIAFFFKELKKNIIQRKKYKLCMRERDLFGKIASNLGLGFSSSIYAAGSKYENATDMPRKIVMPKLQQNILFTINDALFDRPENELNNPKSYGYPDETFAEFIARMETKYNAEAKIINGVLYFEEKNSWNTKGAYQIPNTGDVGFSWNLPNPYGTNLSELAPYYRIAFRTDPTDLNTIHRYRGTSASVQISSPFPITKTHGWGQGQIVDLGSALAKRKYYLTEVEEFFNNLNNLMHGIAAIVIAPINLLIGAINLVIKVLNAIIWLWNKLPGVPNLPQIALLLKIQNPFILNALLSRIGWMETTGDSFSEGKTFIGTDIGGDWELHPKSESVMSGQQLMIDFHGKNLATRGNQWLTYDKTKIPFCCEDVGKILMKNIFSTPDNKFGKFTSLQWAINEEITPQLEYRIKENYIAGLTEKIIIDDTP